ncbi:hypothetical protein ACVIKP_006657 [Rhizobium leguminosarum]
MSQKSDAKPSVNRDFATREHHAADDLIQFVARFRLMLVAAFDFIRLFASDPEIIKQMIVEPG